MTHGPQFFNEPGSAEQYELSGREMAEALILYLRNIGHLDKYTDHQVPVDSRK